MSKLTLAFLGTFSVAAGDAPISAFRTDKTRALLVYLALEAGRPHHRRTLAGLLWPDVSEQHGLDSVRVTLHRLRKTLDSTSSPMSDGLLTITRHSVQFNASDAWIDVADFETLRAAVAAHAHNPPHYCAACLSQLTQAAALYRGELLPGFSLPDAPDFEEWLLLRREQLYVQALLALNTLVEATEAQGDIDSAHTYATRLLKLDPYREATHRDLMRILARRGLPDQALAQYATLRQILQDELGVEPNAQTVTLYEQIREGNLERDIRQHDGIVNPVSLSSADRSEIPVTDSFIGRADDLAHLERWLLREGCRLVAVMGLGGVGKTSLVANAARVATDHFDRVIWRSLLNAPPLDTLLAGVLHTLAQQQVSETPSTLDEQIALLLACLRQQRVLLVLDNLESILEPTQAGRFRPGYEVYEQLLQRVVSNKHRSALLLTSRERPTVVARLEGDLSGVRSLFLEGLDEAAGQELLAHRGLTASVTANVTLIERCSGNPLALKLVTDTVKELFAGDVASFLSENTLIFEDVRNILEQQIGRLTELERTMLFWLTIGREAVDAQTLRQQLVRSPASHLFLEALRGLQNRSLIERHGNRIALQNVVTEYLTDRLVEEGCAEILAEQPDLLHHHALVLAEATDDLRQSQTRLILAPIATQLQGKIGRIALEAKLQKILAKLHHDAPCLPSYAAGNLLSLLLHMGIDVSGYDFSRLCVWQADLRGAHLVNVNLSGADLAHTTFSETFGRIFSVAISPQRHHLAAGGTQGEVYLWSFPEGQRAGLLAGHNNSIMSVAFSPDGTLLASGSLDRTIRIWEWQTGRCLHILTGHSSGVYTVAFSPNGTLLASGSQDNCVYLWDVQTGQRIDELAQHTQTVAALAFHPTGSMLASGSMDHSVCLWDISALSQADFAHKVAGAARLVTILQGHTHQVLAVTFSPDGSLLASSSADTTIILWSTRDHALQATLRGHTHWVRCLAFSRDSTHLFSGSADRTIRLWDIRKQHTVEILRGHTHVIRAIDLDPERSILVSGGLDDSIRLWNITRRQSDPAIRTIQGHVAAIHSLAYSPGASLLAVGDGRGWVRLWRMEQMEREQMARSLSAQALPGRGIQVNGLSFSPDGKLLAGADDDRTVSIWDVSTVQRIGRLTGHGEAVHAACFSPDQELLVTAGYEGHIYIWEIRNPAQGRLLKILKGHTREINALRLSPDGHHLFSGSADNTIRVWDLATGRTVQSVEEESGHCKTLDLSPDGSLLAAAGWAGIIRLYQVGEQGRLHPCQSLRGHATRITQVAFSPTGNHLASGSDGGTVRLWDINSGQEALRVSGHSQPIYCVAFHPKGDHVASGSADGTIRLWSMGGGQPMGECVHILRNSGPYAGMNITDATGISDAQKSTLVLLGAVDAG